MCAILKFVEGDLFFPLGLRLLLADVGLGRLSPTPASLGLLLFSGLELTRFSIVNGDVLFFAAAGASAVGEVL